MRNKIADLHVHPGMKGYANHGYNDNQGLTIWDRFPKKEKELNELNFVIRGAIKEIAKESQAHLDACAEGQVLTPFVSICPPERPMFALEARKPFQLIISLLLPKKKYATLAVAVTGFPKDKVVKILKRVEENKGIDYYQEEYLQEKNYLLDQTQKSSKNHPDLKYRIARDYEEFQQLIEAGNSIVSILTVEGAHAFGNYLYHSTFKKAFEDLTADEEKTLRESFLKNIKEVKNAEYKPFFVTFSHHFNNLLAGHERTMSPRSAMINFLGWPNAPGMRHIFNQEPNLKKGFSPLGKEVLELLLDRENGQRILVDAKHLSIASRQEFYEVIRRKREEENDPIPILYSHAAVNGWATLAEARRQDENRDLDKDNYFSSWQINLTDEDILNIYDSDGMIGLVLHEDRMPGGLFKKKADKLKKKISKYRKKNDTDRANKFLAELRENYLQLIWSNAFHIVKVIRDARQEDGWKVLALGSDYDGLVNPFNAWLDVKYFAALKQEMIEYLNGEKPLYCARKGKCEPLPKSEVQVLMAGRSPDELADAVFFDNVERFLATYFTPQYLGTGK